MELYTLKNKRSLLASMKNLQPFHSTKKKKKVFLDYLNVFHTKKKRFF